jgi:hypothetical protein
MRKGILSVCLILVLMMGISSVWAAQDSTPEPGTPADNECNIGGVLYREDNQDGCPTLWYWKAGWFLARFNRGFISRAEFPKEFESVLPPLMKEEAMGSVCWTAIPLSGFPNSLLYSGVPNLLGNVKTFNSLDCSGAPIAGFDHKSIVIANNPTDAIVICESFGKLAGLVSLSPGYGAAPANAYGCTIH